MNSNYRKAVNYKLYVEKPNGENRLLLLDQVSETQFQRVINLPGEHIFLLNACEVNMAVGEAAICGDFAESYVYVKGVMQDAAGNLYVQIPGNYGAMAIQVSSIDGEWLITPISRATWLAQDLTQIDATIDFQDTNNNGFVEFNLTLPSGVQLRFEQSEQGTFTPLPIKKIIFIHTDLLGTPVAESNNAGVVY